MIKPITLINELRETDRYIQSIFMRGGCYKFHLFLKVIFPKSKPYIHIDKDHIVTKIDNELYDIKGKIEPKFKELYSKLTNEDLKLVESWDFQKNNLLLLTECEFCGEPIVV